MKTGGVPTLYVFKAGGGGGIGSGVFRRGGGGPSGRGSGGGRSNGGGGPEDLALAPKISQLPCPTAPNVSAVAGSGTLAGTESSAVSTGAGPGKQVGVEATAGPKTLGMLTAAIKPPDFPCKSDPVQENALLLGGVDPRCKGSPKCAGVMPWPMPNRPFDGEEETELDECGASEVPTNGTSASSVGVIGTPPKNIFIS